MSEPIRLGVTSVCSPLEVGAADAPALQRRLAASLAAAASRPVEVFSAAPVSDPASAAAAGRLFYDRRVDAVCAIAATWYEDYLVLDMLEECGVPVVAWGRPGMNTGALCGSQQLGFMLRQLGHPCILLYAEADNPAAAELALRYAAAASLRAQLRRARIGMLGHRVEGMTETTAHELALKKLLGPRVVSIDSQVFLERAARMPEAEARRRWNEVAARAGSVTCGEEAGVDSLRVYAALREVIDESGLAAVAVGCYPHLMGRVCLAASLLGEEGVPLACEGDVNGALGMLMLTRLTGAPVHNTDLLDPLPEENAIVFAHCGSGGFSLAARREEIILAPVRLMERGACARFPAKPGPVTLLNITAEQAGYRLAALYGEAVEAGMVFPGNPLAARFASPWQDVLAWIAREGLGHHWMAAYGDLRPELAHLAALTGCAWLSMA